MVWAALGQAISGVVGGGGNSSGGTSGGQNTTSAGSTAGGTGFGNVNFGAPPLSDGMRYALIGGAVLVALVYLKRRG